MRRTPKEIQHDVITQSKMCTSCFVVKSFEEFGNRADSPDKKRHICNDCTVSERKSYQSSDLHKYRSMISRFKCIYGTTEESIRDLMDSQSGCCACCGKSFTWDSTYNIDHDHSTGIIRGLLCSQCNQGIGLLGDDEAGLINAVNYLQGVVNDSP